MTLGESFPIEVQRVRECAQAYRDIGPVGRFALSHIEPLLIEAERALAEQDAVAMIRLTPRLEAVE